MPYLTNAGPSSGPILCREGYDAIDVLLGPDDYTPVGTAKPVGCTEGGIVIWGIIIGDEAVPGHWIVVGREFLLKRWDGRHPDRIEASGQRLRSGIVAKSRDR